jgi:hypothetical protein
MVAVQRPVGVQFIAGQRRSIHANNTLCTDPSCYKCCKVSIPCENIAIKCPFCPVRACSLAERLSEAVFLLLAALCGVAVRSSTARSVYFASST